MADSACIIELASNANEYFTNSALDDIMIHPRYGTQKILLGNSNSQTPSVTVTSNAVGIFTTSPVYTLDVVGDINYTGSLLKNGSNVPTGGGGGGSGLSSQWASDVSNVYVGLNSNVGIGVSNPSVPLEVKGDTKISGNLVMNNRLIMSSLQINRRQGNHANITSTSVIGFSNVDDGVVISIGSNTPAASQSLRAIWSNNEIFRVTGEGDIGIGTSNPLAKLHVVGSTIIDGDINISGTITSSGGGSGLFSQWSNDFSNVFVGEYSNIGIGVSNPSTPLEVNGDATISGNLIMNNRLVMSSLQINRRQGNPANITNTFVKGFSNATNGVVIDIGSNTPAVSQRFQVMWSNNEIFTVTGDGDVGIGTSNPTAKLDVNGDINFTGAFRQNGTPYVGSQWFNSNSNVFLLSSNVGIGKSNPATALDVSGTVTATTFAGSTITTLTNLATYGSNTAIFGSNTAASATATAVFSSNLAVWSSNNLLNKAGGTITGSLDVTNNIKATNNIYAMNRLGVGTCNPSYPLHVMGDINFTGNILQNGVPYSSSSFMSTSNGADIYIGSNTPASAQRLRAFWSSNEIFTITGEGDVGIGTSNPTSKLHVVGTIYATADVVVSSDIRAKSNIERILEPLDKVQQLNGYTFNMIEQLSNQTKMTPKYTGLIAQEVANVLPEAVHIDANDRLSIAYGNIMGLVVEAIKALNEKYEKRIEELERKLELLSPGA